MMRLAVVSTVLFVTVTNGAFSSNSKQQSTHVVAKPKTIQQIYNNYVKSGFAADQQTTVCSGRPNDTLVTFMVHAVMGFYTPKAPIDRFLSESKLKLLEEFRKKYNTKLNTGLRDPFQSSWFRSEFCTACQDANLSLDEKLVQVTQYFEFLVGPHHIVHGFNDKGAKLASPEKDNFVKTVIKVFRVDPKRVKDVDVEKDILNSFNMTNLGLTANQVLQTASKDKNKSFPDECKFLLVVASHDSQYRETDTAVIAAQVRNFFLSNTFSEKCCGHEMQKIFQAEQANVLKAQKKEAEAKAKADKKAEKKAKEEAKKREKEARKNAKKGVMRLRDRV